MVHFVGAGSGAPDLITLRGKAYLEKADRIIYAGSLVNPKLLDYAKADCEIYDSATLYLEQILDLMEEADRQGKQVVRLHTGDASIYGAIREQMDGLKKRNIAYDVCPGVSSFCAAAASMQIEYTLPDVSQSVIITRAQGRTLLPDKERLSSFAMHQATMVIFLSAGLADKVQEELLQGGYGEDTPCALVYKASWPEEKIVRGCLGELAAMAHKEGITKTALIIVGQVLGEQYSLSCLYDKNFETEFRGCSDKPNGEEQ